MPVTFTSEGLWPRLRHAARAARGRSFVAVAYFGQNAAKMLPVKLGSVLVVDASEGAVRTGQTCPEELLKMVDRGIRVYSVQGLHAKVFVLGTRAFVGSANVSGRSASALIEAMFETADRGSVRSARAFVDSLALHELGPEALARLRKIYRPPKLPGGQVAGSRSKSTAGSILRIVQLKRTEYSEEVEAAAKKERRVARSKMSKPRRFSLDEFTLGGKHTFRPGMWVMQVVKEESGKLMVTRPGAIVHIRRLRNIERSKTLVYVEISQGRRIEAKNLAKRLGPGALGRLKRGGVVRPELQEAILRVWKG